MNKALWAAGLLLVAGTATACGGDDTPNDASQEDFCTTAVGIGAGSTGKAVKDVAKKLEDVGTPKDMSSEARKGFDKFIETANKLEDDDTSDEMSDLGKDLSDDDEKNLVAFSEYVAKTCADELKGQLSDLPTPDVG